MRTHVWHVGLAGLATLAVLACGGTLPPKVEAAVGSSFTPPSIGLEYRFDSLDERPLSSVAMRGKTTVLAFITTFDLESQAQVDYLAAMAKNDGDRINYAVIALEPAENREIVEAFRHFVESKFGVSLVMGMGDASTIAGAGPLGDVHVVPTVVILDRAGKVVWRRTGVSKSADVRAGMGRGE